MIKNIKGFIWLCILIVSCQLCINVPPAVSSLIVNYNEYSGAVIIGMIGIISLIIGIIAFGEIKKNIN